MTLTNRNILYILTIWYGSLLTADAAAWHRGPSTVGHKRCSRIDPKNSFVFKKIIDNEDVLLPILNSAFEENFSNITSIRKNTIDAEDAIALTIAFDIYCETQDNRSMIIELQLMGYEESFQSRSIYYVSKVYASQLDKMRLREYAIRPVYFLAFANFNLFPNKEHFITTQVLKDQSTNDMDIEGLKMTFVELDKLKKKGLTSYEQLHTDLEKFAYFLIYDYDNRVFIEILNNLTENNGWIYTAAEVCYSSSWNENEIDVFNERQESLKRLDSVLDSAKEIGKKEGKKQQKKETIIKCSEKGFSTKQIAEIVDLSEEEVQKIIQDHFPPNRKLTKSQGLLPALSLNV